MNANEKPVLKYARCLRELHALDQLGRHDSEEADAIRDEMDEPWYAMTAQERERMGGLSEDLYALNKGGPPQIAMNFSEIQAWKAEAESRKIQYFQGDIDGWLRFWRKPRPQNFPPPSGNSNSVVHFLQAQCWERLGDSDTAALFMKAAEHTDPQLSGLVTNLLNLAGDEMSTR
jgi:hypothetical protein